MTREIKFRARNAGVPRCWIYGYYVVQDGMCKIINKDGCFGVMAGTVCQCTGKKDKNENKIYSRDILKIAGDHLAIVCWNEETAAFACKLIGEDKPYCDHLCAVEMAEKIGSEFENPELLKGGTK